MIRDLIGTREIHSLDCKLLLATTGRISDKTLDLAQANGAGVIQSINFMNGDFPADFFT